MDKSIGCGGCDQTQKSTLEQGDGPVLLETITYRYSGHSPSDASSYRIKEEIEAWQAIDPLEAYAKKLLMPDWSP